jgi:hypothetical protein
MILFPKNAPVIERLNSFYVDIDRLFEHYQGQMACGAVHFKAPSMEGVVFFDEIEPLTGTAVTRDGSLHGPEAARRLIEAGARVNFTLAVFKVPQEKHYFWTRLPEAKPIYDNLSTEFADLSALVRKMTSEHLTGFIEVQRPGAPGADFILFDNGAVVDVCGPEIGARPDALQRRVADLIEATRSGGGSFSVRQILPGAGAGAPAPSEPGPAGQGDDLKMIEELLDIFSRAAAAGREDFSSLFRRKCIANADRYDFLDPFVGEFEYDGGRVAFAGDAPFETLLRGLLSTLAEIAEDLGISDQVRHAVENWNKRWAEPLQRCGISI